MNTTRICSVCRKPLTADAPQGLCPECLLRAGLGTGLDIGPESVSQAESRQVPFVAPTPDELAKLFPQLEILDFLGQGGMGAVYRARQKALDRVVALKILPPGIGQDPAFAERFAREARAMAKLNHPGVVTLYEFGQAEGQFYFLMEFVDGVSLRQLLDAGRLSPREALAIVPHICDALQYAHDRGIVHRDIKPENILLDRQGHVKVADFGLAKLVGAGTEPSGAAGGTPCAAVLTEAGKVMGTPQYMAPEQVSHPADVDHRADIYSLGVVFYQMLTGELPGQPMASPSCKVQIDVRLDEVVLRALEKDRERRYQQVSQMKTDVESIVTKPMPGVDGPAGAVPPLPSPSGRWDWVQAARWSARLLGLSLLLFVAMILGLFLVGTGVPPLAFQSGGTLLNYLAPALIVLGFILGWKFEGTAAVLIAAGWTLWHSSNGTLAWSMFHLALVVAALYALCWWATQGRRTAVLVTVAGTLVTLLVCGMLFLPTNIYLYGQVRNAVNSQPIPNAELTVSYQPVSPNHPLRAWLSKWLWELTVSRQPGSPESSVELARVSQVGWFALHVGWYTPDKQVRVAAPGYATLQISLGPKPLGTRRMQREFALAPLPALRQDPGTPSTPPSAGTASAANPPGSAAAILAAARVAVLKLNLEQKPERRIPELQFAEDKDWLEAAKLATTESDEDVRKALSLLRTAAKLRFGRLLSLSLRKYTQANNGDLPTDLSQLRPFFSVAVDDVVLQRYEIYVTGNTAAPGFNPDSTVVREKSEALPDSYYDERIRIGLNYTTYEWGQSRRDPGLKNYQSEPKTVDWDPW
jgi:predicted Ser/Thr protein kinase